MQIFHVRHPQAPTLEKRAQGKGAQGAPHTTSGSVLRRPEVKVTHEPVARDGAACWQEWLERTARG